MLLFSGFIGTVCKPLITRNKSRPGNRHPVGINTQLMQKLYIFLLLNVNFLYLLVEASYLNL